MFQDSTPRTRPLAGNISNYRAGSVLCRNAACSAPQKLTHGLANVTVANEKFIELVLAPDWYTSSMTLLWPGVMDTALPAPIYPKCPMPDDVRDDELRFAESDLLLQTIQPPR